MNWFYAEGNQQNGPVSDSQLEELLSSGKITHATLVWHEGMPEWQPLNVARSSAADPGTVCIECGKSFPPDELIRLNNASVCAQCKPVFLQRMAENAPTPSSGSLWRSGKRVVARTDTVFPDRCVRCNESAGTFRLKRTLYWAHPLIYLLILCNLLILLIVYLIIRKKAIVYIGLCEHHRARRKLGMIIGWSSVALGIIMIVAGAFLESGWLALTGLLILIAGGITGGVMARTVTPTKIDKEYVWLSGVNRDLVANLPEWRGP
jgi:hypothetical protein